MILLKETASLLTRIKGLEKEVQLLQNKLRKATDRNASLLNIMIDIERTNLIEKLTYLLGEEVAIKTMEECEQIIEVLRRDGRRELLQFFAGANTFLHKVIKNIEYRI